MSIYIYIYMILFGFIDKGYKAYYDFVHNTTRMNPGCHCTSFCKIKLMLWNFLYYTINYYNNYHLNLFSQPQYLILIIN